jgi:hypothetical protein
MAVFSLLVYSAMCGTAGRWISRKLEKGFKLEQNPFTIHKVPSHVEMEI